ncbi:AAA family ATPase [Polyangium spumosum]|uniref:AAA family ATPase n=1 Tax=Polyangium spumosum TaxID=889282 RepID=A0A6N7Q5M8_9BACT|nr:AAA family ATPase [Polyangium spumosum]MRG96151.1 AAA family ATPase [Polyangium spumosum]
MVYRIVGPPIHEGSNTVIYRGERDDGQNQVVIKLPRGDVAPRDIDRLRHEYAILKAIDAPGVVKALALEPSERGVALVLEALPGETLAALLRARRLDVPAALTIARSIAGILGGVHRLGIVHGDVKPQNILYRPETGSVHLIDFGLARRMSAKPERVAPDAIEGTLAYIAPEQTGRMNRPVDHRADLYSFGVTLYQMLTAALPFSTTDAVELVFSHIARVPAAPREVDGRIPDLVSALVMKLLAKAPEDRYQTARGVELDLDACLRQIEATGTTSELTLGRHDAAGVLRLPDRLYGRAGEGRTLRDAFERLRRGAAELVLVAGPSGVGKSALVHELRRGLARDEARFIAGKFDLLSRSVPYGPLIHAFRELLQQLLGESAAELEDHRARLSHALGGNGQVIVELVPEARRLLGEQHPLPAVGPTESQNRMNLALKSFVQVFASATRPLVLFLDDLQWADAGSLKLLEVLLVGRDCPGLVILGAYRDNEVDAAHPLTATLAALRKEGVVVSEIGLVPLGAAELGDWLADALVVDAARVAPLARAIHAKTQGNPFFVGQFLHALHEGQLLRFDAEASAWCWDIAAIEAREVTDNVVDLIVKNITILAPETRRVLLLASCIGHEFTLQTLATIDASTLDQVEGALLPAAREGLVAPGERGGVYRFLHDRVQQAAYALIEDADRAATHLRIGRLLLAGTEARDEALFEIVEHLNRGEALMTDPAERIELAERNLLSGRKAKASNAYDAAAHHFRVGTTLLPESAWADLYPLTFALHQELAECDYLCGRFEQAEALFERLAERARSRVDLANVFAMELRLYQVAGRYAEAVDLGFRALRRFGVESPETDEAVQAATRREMEGIQALLGDRPIESLVEAPVMADPEHNALMGILNELLSCSYIGRPAVFPLSAMRAVSYSLRHGNSPESCFSYSCYAILLVAFGQIPTAVAISELALAVNERFGDAATRGRLLHVHGNHIQFWRKHYRACFPVIERAFEACLAVGDFVHAGFISHAITWLSVERGESPADVLRTCERFAAFARQSRNEPILLGIRTVQQFVKSLERHAHPERPLDDEQFRGEDCLAALGRAGFGPGVAFYHIMVLVLHYMAGRHDEALASAERAREILGCVMTLPIEVTFHLHEALALLARGPAADPEAARREQQRIDESLDKLARWAEHGPENYEHKHCLLRAEAARVAGRHLEADDLYDRAIVSAREGGFTQYEALANELAGKALLARGRRHLAPVYLRAAHAAYVRWGAAQKAERLAEAYPQIVPAGPLQSPATLQSSTAASGSGARGMSGVVDTATVLRLGQALAGETELPKVIEQLMRIVLHNAGASRGCLLLDRGGVLRIEATIAVSPDVVTIRDGGPMEESADWPVSVLRYAARTREVVVVGDAAADPRFTKERSSPGRGLLSILCVPLVHRRRLVGLLHLENGLARDAFGAERIEFLELLCGQAATALENALLFGRLQETSDALRRSNERLEADVAKRTQDLREVNTRLTEELEERARAEHERAALQEEIIRVQTDLLAELSTPLIPITDDILVMPLVGAMDARRAERVMDTVLVGASTSGAKVVIMDITGMKTVDDEAASALIRAASALRLLGMQAWLTGVRKEVAQTLIELGIDLGDILTFGSLKRGVAHAARLARENPRGRGAR